MRRSRLTTASTAALAGAAVLAGCAGTAQAAPLSAPEAQALMPGIDAAGFDIFHAARGETDNTVISPASIGLAFGMAYAGANGSVAEAIQMLFDLPADQDEVLAGFAAYQQALSVSPGTKGTDPVTGDEVELPTVRVSNRVFTDTGFTARDQYLTTVEETFGAGVQELPLSTDHQAAADGVNDWISDSTEGLIEDLVKPDSLNAYSRLILANALYLKASWAETFDEEATVATPFRLLGGGSVEVPLMWNWEASGDVSFGEDYAAARIPYAGGGLEFMLIVPEEGSFEQVQERFDADLVDEIVASSQETDYILGLPRFTTGSEVDLRDTIEGGLGVQGLFDVVGLDGIGDDLVISGASHGTRVIVDEEGTEAAAATVIEVQVTSAGPEPVRVVADRPFLYVIRDVDSGAALFVGRVLDPTV